MSINSVKSVFTGFFASVAVAIVLCISPPPLWANVYTGVDPNISFDDKLALADKVRSSHPKQFLVLVNELNEDASDISSAQQYYLDYLNIYLLMYQGNFTQATSASEALISSGADSLLRFRAKLGLVNIFAMNQSWTEGLTHLQRVLNELPTIQDKKTYHFALTVAAVFYNQLEQYELGLLYAKKVELTSKDGREQCFAKLEIIKASLKLKKLTPTDPSIRHAISLCRINKEHLIISTIKYHVAEKYIENQQQNEALQILSEGLQDALNTKYPQIIAKYHSLLAQGYWLNNNIELTKKYALRALEHKKNESANMAKVLSYKLLFEVEQAAKNYELALKYHKQYTQADKLYYNETQAKHLAFQLAKHQTIEQENRINLLNEKNAVLTAEKSLLTAEQALANAEVENNYFIMMVLLATLSVLLFWGLRLLKAHKRIKQLAEYDSLTRAFNRGHFTQVAEDAIRFCHSAEQELSVIMFDLDNFKNINDNYGHACGDWALKKSVQVCKNLGRKNDIFARLGGEEFCILLTSCDKKLATQRAEAYRQAIANITTSESGFNFTLTASFGVTCAKTSGYALDKLLAGADSATYKSKHLGRNQVTVFEIEKSDQLTLPAMQLDDSRHAF